jgi:hypothetical protein
MDLTRTQFLSGASPETLLTLRFPVYDHTFSKSAGENFPVFESFPLVFLLTACVLRGLQELPLAGEEDGVPKGEAYGVC